MGALAHSCSIQLENTPSFGSDVLAGLSASQKRIPAKYFYDALGSDLFEDITQQPEYYPTRCEMQILRDRATEIGQLISTGAAVIEFGSGSNKKARLLLRKTPQLTAYVPVDICGEILEREALELRADFPKFKILPVTADFNQPFELPLEAKSASARVGFFPGSTIGNFEPHEAVAFLRNVGDLLKPHARFIIGIDLIKSAKVLNAAYNDAAGITAQFNKNLLTRINRELGGNFDLGAFEHHAFYNDKRNRIEMHLVSLQRQKVKVNGETIEFRAGETIHTENSYKYSIESFAALARGAGWLLAGAWVDASKYFSLQAFTLDEVSSKLNTAE